MKDSITVIFGFDVETDLGSWTPFYRGIEKGIPKLLELLDVAEVKATFFFTGEAAYKFPVIVREVDIRGHEVGCHSLYHETLGDELFPIPGIKPLLPEEVPIRIKKATQLVETALGRKVLSFRCPRLWGSTAVVNVLEDLGFIADVSYPLYYYKEKLTPYHPNRNDWTKEGDMNLVEIPNFADISMESHDKFGRDRDQWPLFRTKGANRFMVSIRNYISCLKEKSLPVVLCFYMHPWEFIDMPRGFIHYGEGSVKPDDFITKNCGDKALMELKNLIRALKEEGATFMTALELVQIWG